MVFPWQKWGSFLWNLMCFKRRNCVYSWCGRLCVQMAWRVSLSRWSSMIDLVLGVQMTQNDKKWIFHQKSRVFSEIWCVLTQKRGLWVTDNKNYGTFSKEWGPRVKRPTAHWIGGQKECTWCRPWLCYCPRGTVEIHYWQSNIF